MPKSQNPLKPGRTSTLFTTLKASKPKGSASINRLEDVGTISSLPPAGVRQDIVSLIRYINAYSFDDLPERAGLNSSQTSTILRFRASLPPIVSLAHVYALSSSPTATERELARLLAAGVLRKVSIPGRGKGGTSIGDGIVLVEDWVASTNGTDLPDDVKTKYCDLMRSQPVSPLTSTQTFSDQEIRALMSKGFLTTPAALSADLKNLFAPLSSSSSLVKLSSTASAAPTGSMAAVGGISAVHDSGGGGNTLASSSTRDAPNARQAALLAREMTFSLPNTGSFLKLQAEARAHLLFLLKQVSPKWKESTIDLLREKWNGGFGNVDVSQLKRARKEGNGLLAGQTRKWRMFSGLRFEYVLAEALGSGAIELFDTGSVGAAVRMR